MEHWITIREELDRTIKVEADSVEEALQKAEQLYNNEEIVLDYSDYNWTDYIYEGIVNDSNNPTN